MRDGFTIPMPKPGDGTKLIANPDGSLTCSWDKPLMAMDAALIAPDRRSGPFNDGGDPEGDDLPTKIHQLLDGKLDDGDIETLLELIKGGRRARGPRPSRSRATDSRALWHTSAPRAASTLDLAQQARTTTASLVKRFPALKNARVM